jgi:hypothetical protein
VERVLQPRKERRQEQLAEVTDAVRESDEAHDGGVVAAGVGHGKGDGEAHGVGVRRLDEPSGGGKTLS